MGWRHSLPIDQLFTAMLHAPEVVWSLLADITRVNKRDCFDRRWLFPPAGAFFPHSSDYCAIVAHCRKKLRMKLRFLPRRNSCRRRTAGYRRATPELKTNVPTLFGIVQNAHCSICGAHIARTCP